jgi:hypothetical protein
VLTADPINQEIDVNQAIVPRKEIAQIINAIFRRFKFRLADSPEWARLSLSE